VVKEVGSAFGDESRLVAPQDSDVAAQAGAEMFEFDVVATQAGFDGVSGLGFLVCDLSIPDRDHGLELERLFGFRIRFEQAIGHDDRTFSLGAISTRMSPAIGDVLIVDI